MDGTKKKIDTNAVVGMMGGSTRCSVDGVTKATMLGMLIIRKNPNPRVPKTVKYLVDLK